jgi:hypothetical protein
MEKEAEIIIEIDEKILLTNSPPKFEAFCPECKRLVVMTSPAVAAIELQISEREIFRLMEIRKIHFVETDRILVCLNSFYLSSEAAQ